MKMRSKMQNEKGFTLVELMVVVVILGILVAIAVPVYQNVTANANRKSVEANLRTIDGAIAQYEAVNNGSKPSNGNELNAYLQVWPTGPDKVTYAIDGGRAQATSNGSGNWFGVGPHKLPVTWPAS